MSLFVISDILNLYFKEKLQDTEMYKRINMTSVNDKNNGK